MRSRRAIPLLGPLAAGAAAAAIFAATMVVSAPDVRAAGNNQDCKSKCVMLIEIAGLEPKDVTKQNTPFLWDLAHSNDQAEPGLQQDPVFQGRNGWSWQAARDVMGTGIGPSTEALLTGDTAEQSAMPADLFARPDYSSSPTTLKWYSLGGSDQTSGCPESDPCDPSTTLNGVNVLSAAATAGKNVGIWLGDPALCKLANNGLGSDNPASYDTSPGTNNGFATKITSPDGCPALWAQPPSSPGAPPSSAGPPTPYCPPPSTWPDPDGNPQNQWYPNACPMPDSTVLGEALNDLGTHANGWPDLSFIELPEIGLIKQRYGDADCFAENSCGASSSSPNSTGAPSPEPSAVLHALHNTDAALAFFIHSIVAQQQQGTNYWANTYLMVVGSNGYEATPSALRVPDRNVVGQLPNGLASYLSSNATSFNYNLGDLTSFVATDGGSRTDKSPNAVLVPQGTFATIYYQGDPANEAATLSKLHNDLCGPLGKDGHCGNGGQVNPACNQLFQAEQAAGNVPAGVPVQPNCIENVYYVDPTVFAGADPSTYSSGQFLFGLPTDPGYPTPTNPSYDPNPDCQGIDSGLPFYDPTKSCDPQLKTFYTSQHASWHLDVFNPLGPVATNPADPSSTATVFQPDGSGGQMVVELAPGWAGGPFVGSEANANSTIGISPVGTLTDPADPWNGSTGGPRDRAVAAIINGPASAQGEIPVVSFPEDPTGTQNPVGGMAPVMAPSSDYNPADDASEPDKNVCAAQFMLNHAAYHDNPSAGTLAVDDANANPGNDSAVFGSLPFNSQYDSYSPPGMECQAQTIDFAPTIEALQAVQPDLKAGQEADARFLDEAFADCVGGNFGGGQHQSRAQCGYAEQLGSAVKSQHIVAPPVVEQPVQIIYKLPPPPKGYDFHGLVRNVQAQVVDQSNNTVPNATPGTYLSSIRITGDFGKPLSEVTITLYHRATTPARDRRGHAHAARTHLTAIVRFCPFTVTRAPNVELRFEVPSAYAPDHVGLAVRQAKALSSATGPGCGAAKHNAFLGVGPVKGALVPILDASLLHHFKPCPAALSVPLPRGAGTNLRAVTIRRSGRVVMAIPGWKLKGAKLVIPASKLPAGPLVVQVQWQSLQGRRLATRYSVRGFLNCTAAERQSLGLM